MGDIIQWVLLVLAAIFGGGFLFEKAKAKKAEKKAAEQTGRADRAERQVHLEQEASKIKDQLAARKAETQIKKNEVIQKVNSVEKEVPLGDEVAQLAADQSARARARADRVQDD